MKKLFLKNMMPAAVIALAVGGAFATTSMQSAPKEKALKWGNFPNATGGCSNEQIECIETPGAFCQVDDNSPIAYDLDTNCVQPLYKQNP
ncbi:DUF6520 family protein [Flavobacterium johnsoniae]|uniref:Uncharacterized protein n=1 Tax=Flavobacterium johnsoniae TaxID=986 RepID=A0A1M5QRW8_FLAJO|nr:DUF6520 family protein [Flavobacterium johnsoniae]SHH16520.1 hypothetical protein SAMN05444388_107135 [Flavobacterium johnsoniae]